MPPAVEFEANNLAKEANGVQKEIAAKKKVRPAFHSVRVRHSVCEKAKENADELVAKKKDIETRVTEKRTEAKDLEAKMFADLDTMYSGKFHLAIRAKMMVVKDFSVHSVDL